jgi:hypothetical protein
LKPVWENSSWDCILQNPSLKRDGGVTQGVVPEFKTSTKKKKGVTRAKIEKFQTKLKQTISSLRVPVCGHHTGSW